MNIVFITTQSLKGSTVIGRVLPLAKELAKKNKVSVLVHSSQHPTSVINTANIFIKEVGKNPFSHTVNGKKRLRGIALIGRMKMNALRTLFTLIKTKPDVAIIVKPLPQNVLAAYLYKAFSRKTKFILDVDDFELTANKLTSIWQRAIIHWSERTGAKIATSIIAATPFLQDHFTQLTAGKKEVKLIPTGLNQINKDDSASSIPSILYIGSVSMSSGHRVDLLPEILGIVKNEIPEIKLIIAGSGDDVATLKEDIAGKNLAKSVEWFGRFTAKDVPNLVARASVIIDPIDGSVSNRAKSSYRTALAAVTGTAIITSNIGIRPELIPQEIKTASFAEAESPKDYAEKIIARIKNPLTLEEKESMKKHAIRYTWNTLAQQYAEIIAAL